VNAFTETPGAQRSRSWLLPLVVASLILNVLVVAAIVVLFASEGARDSVADALGLARSADVELAKDAAAAADARAAGAEARAEQGPSAADVERLSARVSNFAIELSSAETKLADQKAQLAAACDWARLQATNSADSGLANVFLDYEKTVCP
jgi:hypothetical protein